MRATKSILLITDVIIKAIEEGLDERKREKDDEAEKEAVAVGSDVLAWRSIIPLQELTKVVFKPKRYRQTAVVADTYIVQINDKVIDEDIRAKPYQGRAEYEAKFLATLKKEVKKIC